MTTGSATRSLSIRVGNCQPQTRRSVRSGWPGRGAPQAARDGKVVVMAVLLLLVVGYCGLVRTACASAQALL